MKRGHTGASLGGRIEGKKPKRLTKAQREARELAEQKRRTGNAPVKTYRVDPDAP